MDAGAAYGYRESELTAEHLTAQLLDLMHSPELDQMAAHTRRLAVSDSNVQCAKLVQNQIEKR
jgi:UDP-N-acetylglucosamine:LPS N-acetylglucosamine transferase